MWKSYEECEQLILPKLDKLKEEKKLKDFCSENNLEYQQLVNFRSKKETKRPGILRNILQAFGYNVIKIKRETLQTFGYNVTKIKTETLFDLIKGPKRESIESDLKKATLKKAAKKKE